MRLDGLDRKQTSMCCLLAYDSPLSKGKKRRKKKKSKKNGTQGRPRQVCVFLIIQKLHREGTEKYETSGIKKKEEKDTLRLFTCIVFSLCICNVEPPGIF
ncbi:uncharacterized protein MCYG_00674 [Microsporum canis CBS 113480]|uniref:Uncharacterized protein n=1 Tax=Arthroderma otae (strain ATCC MYA-4605 / CBS 113480) TaxID=554155 RepID=C5FDA2_ARTOC|nr:uncharacterized protein MCYG_00674 [Microsporum canis CBS 113480]EEQ27786.1 predicted protein [Microsporum canis CBS 113480]